ncbi:hypothetical protein [Iamia sp.]|uniref:hypothetical protein n=1 Tax=Iamia sp. TaxID=2722710 RepID=UPI002C945841|nr:hypothetical protein [Iamia sp.]HXH59249.1 hypothetical protein [Iamia sp.]
MPRKVTPSPTGVWKLVARVQRIALSEGLRGKGGTWVAVGVGAWGLQRVRSLAGKEDEILLREPIAPGETITITNETTTRAEADERAKAAKKQGRRLERQADDAEKVARKARKELTRAGRRQLAAQQAKEAAVAARRAERRRGGKGRGGRRRRRRAR